MSVLLFSFGFIVTSMAVVFMVGTYIAHDMHAYGMSAMEWVKMIIFYGIVVGASWTPYVDWVS